MRTSTVELFDQLADFDIYRCIFDTPPPPCPTLSPSIALPDANLQPFPPVPQPWPTPFSTGANPGVERPGRLLVSYGRATFPPQLQGAESGRIPFHVAAARSFGARRLWCANEDPDARAVCTACRGWPMLVSSCCLSVRSCVYGVLGMGTSPSRALAICRPGV